MWFVDVHKGLSVSMALNCLLNMLNQIVSTSDLTVFHFF